MIQQLHHLLYVSSQQITPENIPDIADRGIQTIICNRFDGEVEQQPTFETIKQEAALYQMQAIHIPIVSGQFTRQAVEAFANALHTYPTPILAYCRTGTRSTILWALGQKAAGTPPADILLAAKSAGYDLAPVIG